MKFQWLKARQTKYTAYFTAYLLVILAVLTTANWLADRHNKSFDATSEKRFSLADQTKKVAGNLSQDVTITYFNRTSDFGRARDLLERYDNLSPRLRVVYVDPDKDPQTAKSYGVRTYGTTFVEAADRREEAKSLTEEEVTGALIRSLKTGEQTVCAVSGSGEHSLEDTDRTGYSSLKELLENNNYGAQSISLLESPEVPEDCTILLVGGPRYDYTEPAVKAIETYVQNGGRALLMIDPPLRLGGQERGDNRALAKLVESWGIVLNQDLALDTSGIGQLFGLSEVVPLVTNYEFHPIVREMKEIATAFPVAQTLEVKSAESENVRAEELFSTSSNSFATTNLGAGQVRIDPDRDRKGPLTLGAAGTYDTGQEGEEGRFVVVGSSGWVANNIVRFNGNRDLFMNMINWLSADEDLISIRPREPADRRLTLTRAQMSRIFYASVVGLPLIVVAFGIGVWWRRR